jgi:VanZ family protein
LNRKVIVLIPLALLLALLFFFGGPNYYSTRSFKYFWDQGHIIFFAIFAYIIISFWPKLSEQPFWRQCALILGMTLSLGLAVEIGQSGIDRSPSFFDLIRDLIGASLALFFWPHQGKSCQN